MNQIKKVLGLPSGYEQAFCEGLPPQGVSAAWLLVGATDADEEKAGLSTELAVLEGGIWQKAIDWRAQASSGPVAGVIRGWAFYVIPGQDQGLMQVGQLHRNLALCIQKLAWLVRLKNPDSDAAKGAINLLRRYGLLGSPLRAVETEEGGAHV